MLTAVAVRGMIRIDSSRFETSSRLDVPVCPRGSSSTAAVIVTASIAINHLADGELSQRVTGKGPHGLDFFNS